MSSSNGCSHFTDIYVICSWVGRGQNVGLDFDFVVKGASVFHNDILFKTSQKLFTDRLTVPAICCVFHCILLTGFVSNVLPVDTGGS